MWQKRKRAKKQENGIDFITTFIILIVACIVLILGLYKVDLSNQIYYESRKVNKLQSEVIALRAQKRLLKHKVEMVQYKMEVIDTIF